MAGAGPGRGEPYRTASRPVIAFADLLGADQGTAGAVLLDKAAAALDRFSAELERAGVPGTMIAPARLALALLLDQRARANRALDIRQWGAGAHRILFDGREMNQDLLADFIRRARAAGPDFDDVRTFLEECEQRLSGARLRFDRSTGSSWTGIVLVLILAFLLTVAGWAGYVEWRFQRGLSSVFDAEALSVGLDREGTFPDLAERLDRLRAARDQVAAQAAKAPIRLFAGVGGFDAAARADLAYRAAVNRQLPAALASAIDAAVATEGDPVVLYDAMRAWSILSGASDFSAPYLAGWLSDRGGSDSLVAGLAKHADALSPPFGALPPPDPELFAQARRFAAEAPEPDRAFLELFRGPGAAALPVWIADDRVPHLSDVVERRSGRPINTPIPGLFTAEGWDYARDFGAGIAVQTARTEAARLFDKAPASQNDSADQIMSRLQARTLTVWSDFLSDLHVRPFNEPETAILVSGRLSAADSPLVPLLKEVWNEAGGNDRHRDFQLQLAIAAEFAPMIQYVEQGHMADIARLFAALNVALGAMDREEQTGLQRLMSVKDRGNSIATLRQAPTLVEQIVEDVLAQTAAAHADMLTNPVTRSWQTEVLPVCKSAIEARFPFSAEGADADPAAVTRLLAPGGLMDRFFHANVAPYLDMSGPKWRWKPEARFSGLAPESAEFFHAAQGLTSGLFDTTGQLHADLSMTALAEKGKASVTLGGATGPVETAADSLPLSWPGADSAQGVEFRFQTPDGSAVVKEPGAWGLMRVLLPLRLRERDGGKRFLVDLRAGAARLFVEIAFASANNPLAQRGALKGFACPPVL